MEPIWMFFTLKNNGIDGPKIMHNDLTHCLIIQDFQGNISQIHVSDNVDREFVPRMKQGEIFEDKINLLFAYGIQGNYKLLLPLILLPEQYSIHCIWKENGYEPVISNKLEIVVEEPTGDEWEAMKIYKNGLYEEGLKNIRLPDAKFDELLDKYPESVYTPIALYEKMGSHFYRESDEDRKIAMIAEKKLLEDYPECCGKYSGWSFRTIRKYYESKGDLHGYKKFVMELHKKTKSQGIKNTVERILERLEKEEL